MMFSKAMLVSPVSDIVERSPRQRAKIRLNGSHLVRAWEPLMFRRLFYLVLLAVFLALGALAAYLLHQHFLIWWACKDEWGLCFADGSNRIDRAAPMGIPLAYAAITLVLGLLSLKALWGMLRPRRRHCA
jgi:hypothetical protein